MFSWILTIKQHLIFFLNNIYLILFFKFWLLFYLFKIIMRNKGEFHARWFGGGGSEKEILSKNDILSWDLFLSRVDLTTCNSLLWKMKLCTS